MTQRANPRRSRPSSSASRALFAQRIVTARSRSQRLAVALSALALVFAFQPAYSSTITVTTTDDELLDNSTCSLREAIRAANSDAAVDACAAGNGADTILLPAGTYTLTIEGRAEDASASGDLDITSDLAIQGAGADVTIVQACAPTPEELSCPGIDRVFHIDPAGARITVEISGLTVQNGSTVLISFVNSAGGAILLGVANTLGDRIPAGTLTLRDSIVRNSSTPRDGAESPTKAGG